MSAPGHCASGMTGAAPPVNEQQRLDDLVTEYLRARRYADVIPLRPQGGVR